MNPSTSDLWHRQQLYDLGLDLPQPVMQRVLGVGIDAGRARPLLASAWGSAPSRGAWREVGSGRDGHTDGGHHLSLQNCTKSQSVLAEELYLALAAAVARYRKQGGGGCVIRPRP
ncbi:hypothetical protein STEG23_033283 [Scotinomys teguina]